MAIQTSKTNAHLQRPVPKPLRKSGLHSIHESSTVYGAVTAHPLERAVAFDERMRAISTRGETPMRNSTTRGLYTGSELKPSFRPGAMDAYSLPSLRPFPRDSK